MRILSAMIAGFILFPVSLFAQDFETKWRYYRPGNTGIQGDYATALWIDHEGNPYIAANTGNWGEGGLARFDQLQNSWVNFSNVDYPVLGSFENADVQILDIVEDFNHNLWMGTYTGALYLNPDQGINSAIRYTSGNSMLTGNTYDLDLAPDSSLWFTGDGITRYNPLSQKWNHWSTGNVRLSVQPKPDGSYLVWSADYYYGYVMVYNSATEQFTEYLPANEGEVAGLPGKDCADDAGNFWVLRMSVDGNFETLEYQKPDGTWVYPAPPYSNVSFYIDAFRAYGNGKAAMVLFTGEVWFFNGTEWQNLGTWRPGTGNTAIDADDEDNVWVCGTEGAAKFNASIAEWQRYRLTNTSQIDYFVQDISIDTGGNVWMTGNAGSGVGGFQKFDGKHWLGFNPYTYGLGHDFPFQADNTQAILYRPSNDDVVFNPTFNGIHGWDGQDYYSIEPFLSTSRGFAEDLGGRLWSLEEYFGVRYYDEASGEWTRMEITGWGLEIEKDPVMTDAVWAMADFEVRRTNGIDNFSMRIEDFPSGSVFTGLAVTDSGSVWVGTWSQFSSVGSTLIHMDPETGSYQIWQHDEGWPFPGEHVRPLLISPDGLLWLQYDSEYPSEIAGICSFDGTHVVVYPSAPGGIPQWGGLPNSTIKDSELKIIENGYEIWLSCLGRGVAVLEVKNPVVEDKKPVTEKKDLIRVYPNPSEGMLNIDFKTEAESNNTLVRVYDMSGKLISQLNAETDYAVNGSSLELDLTFLRDGFYILQFIKDNATIHFEKVIIKKDDPMKQ